jgi:hypothetical protein
MTLSRLIKVLVGVVTAWPLLYVFIFMGTILATMAGMVAQSGHDHASGPGHAMPAWFAMIFVLHFLTILIMFVLIAFYIAYLFRTDRVAQDKKALWAVVLFLGNMAAMPVFFWLYVWPEHWPSTEPAKTPATT